MNDTDLNMKDWSDNVAALAVDMLIDYGFVRKEDFDKAADVVAEEILVRLSVGDYPPIDKHNSQRVYNSDKTN